MLTQGMYREELAFTDTLFGLAAFPVFPYIAERFIHSLIFFGLRALPPLHTENGHPSLKIRYRHLEIEVLTRCMNLVYSVSVRE